MTTSARLEPPASSVLPGEEVRIGLEVRNSGEIVEAYHFEVLGAAAEWCTVEPDLLSLYPGTTGQVSVLVRPPVEDAPLAGPVPFAVRVQPQERPQDAAVPEGVVEILPIGRFDAELSPQISQGRGTGRHRLALDNRGNRPVSATLAGADRGELLTFELPAAPVSTDPGRASFVDLKVRPERRIWRGTAVPHAFRLTVVPDGAEPLALDGTYVQQPVLSRGLLRALALLLVLAAVLAGLWFGLLRPSVKSLAKEAVKEPLESAQAQASAAEKKAGDAAKAAAEAQKAAGVTPPPSPSSSPSASPVPGAPAPGPEAALFSTRLTASPATGKEAAQSYTVPEGKTLRLTDLVLENPQGDSGTVTISVDDKPLLAPALENFREQDFHWASAILVNARQRVTVRVNCQAPGHPPTGPAPSTCSAAALISGTLG
ncbi:COG1470 family protein [Kitasatospora sp. NPDC001664]